MIHVEKQPEPRPPDFDFDREVRQRGLSALAELTGNPPTIRRPGPRLQKRAARIEDLTVSDIRDYPYWTQALDALHRAYGGICAYSCFYIEPVSGKTVDHFVAMARAEARLAYEWDNYRLASSLMNARKSDHADVLDPFLVEDGWFELDLGTLKVQPSTTLEPELAQRVRDTIDRLQLDSRECTSMRRRWLEAYWRPPRGARPIPLWFLEQQAPFLAREIRRQGWLNPEDREATPVVR